MAVEANLPATPSAPVAEGSLLGRGVALLTPVFAIAAGWIAGVVAHLVPGANLDQTQIVAFMIAVSTSALTAAWKWLQGAAAQRSAAPEESNGVGDCHGAEHPGTE